MVSKTQEEWTCTVVLATAFLMTIGHNTLALGYRPFISTDAAVADPKEMEVELGYFALERADKENIFTVPQVVINYGIAQNWEVIGEFRVEKPADAAATLVSPGLFLKGISKGAPDWLFTTGLTWSFSFPAVASVSPMGGRP